MKKYILLVLILSLILAGCSKPTTREQSGSDEKIYVIKAGHAASKEHFAQKSFEKFKEIVETNSKGKIKVEIYP